MKTIGGELTMICHSEVPPSGVPHCQHIPDMDSPSYLIRPDRYDIKDKIHVAEILRTCITHKNSTTWWYIHSGLWLESFIHRPLSLMTEDDISFCQVQVLCSQIIYWVKTRLKCTMAGEYLPLCNQQGQATQADSDQKSSLTISKVWTTVSWLGSSIVST